MRLPRYLYYWPGPLPSTKVKGSLLTKWLRISTVPSPMVRLTWPWVDVRHWKDWFSNIYLTKGPLRPIRLWSIFNNTTIKRAKMSRTYSMGRLIIFINWQEKLFLPMAFWNAKNVLAMRLAIEMMPSIPCLTNANAFIWSGSIKGNCCWMMLSRKIWIYWSNI